MLTGRHGLFATYEAFAMVSALDDGPAHASGCRRPRELRLARAGAVAERAAHLDLLAQRPQRLQPPGPGADRHDDLAAAARSSRVYLPPDANCLLSVADHCLRSRDYVNLIVIDKQPQLQYLDLEAAREHCARGASVWDWAGTDDGDDPDVVLACAGDVATHGDAGRRLAAAPSTRPSCAVRVVNVVDLMALFPADDHPHGMDERALRRAVHRRRRRRVRLPRLPARHPPAAARPPGRRPLPRARLHRAGHHHDAVRHGGAQPDEPLPPGARGAAPRPAQRPSGATSSSRALPRRCSPATRVYVARAPRGHARGPRLDAGTAEPCDVLVVNVGSAQPEAAVARRRRRADRRVEDLPTPADHGELRATLRDGPRRGAGRVDAVGHRVVHGGPDPRRPAVRRRRRCSSDSTRSCELAPLHNPPRDRGDRGAATRSRRTCPSVACFDTAFHATLPAAASRYAVPARWDERWGCAATASTACSHAYAGRRAAELLGGPSPSSALVTCHLGAGASLAAVARRPLASTPRWASRRSRAW